MKSISPFLTNVANVQIGAFYNQEQLSVGRFLIILFIFTCLLSFQITRHIYIHTVCYNRILQNPTPSTSGEAVGLDGRTSHRPLETLSEGHTDEDGGPSPRSSIPRGIYIKYLISSIKYI